ncbi:hypothetical protein AAFF_G00065140 [Aldrovandia affinis]|uniref:Ig-like domain-containing protein n=1 Tax=Aldrovandia affinis TaxID=143900 RepID=A0AAD7T5H5_9TELE|nr:hypothetical protein AAFF_G00065140 [Aldrovandia affinis]
MISLRRGHGMARWGLCWVLLGLWRFSAACPASCTCNNSRISCTDEDRGIVYFPLLQSDIKMEDVTEIYIENQNRFFAINDKDLKFYRNLRNLTVTNTKLTTISHRAFQNNGKLQYLNLKYNNLSFLSWKSLRHLNISFPLLSGNPLQCRCENVWIRQWLGEESDRQELDCVEDGGRRRPFSKLSLPDCASPTVKLSPSRISVVEGGSAVLVCHVAGAPRPQLLWNVSILVSSYEVNTSNLMSELCLSNLSSSDNGRSVSCIAENVVGENTASVVLDILFPPEITKLTDAVSDHHWCIPFSVAGNPQPELQWLFNGITLPEGDYIGTKIHDTSENEYHGCLQLDNPTHVNNGQYTLLAKNKYGQDEKSVTSHFMKEPWENGTATDPLYYDTTTEDTPLEQEDSAAVYVVVGIAAVAFTGFVLMLIILKFGRNSKFGIKGFVLFHNSPQPSNPGPETR